MNLTLAAAIFAFMLFGCITTVHSSAIRNKEGHDKRTYEKELSEKEHNLGEQDHNAVYDHEAFLGREQAEEFDELSPEESKKRLGDIVDKIDTNGDGFIDAEEMVKWIKYIQKRYVSEDAQSQWSHYGKGPDDVIEWPEYANRTYGSYNPDAPLEGDFADLRRRDKRRFDQADLNKDGKLTFTEYVDFLHPEDAEHMRDIVVIETMEDIDKNQNGVIEENEYIGDMWPGKDSGDEPDWVKTEREHFNKWRDLNKDGVMDKEEVKHWIMPEDYDHAQAETNHLIYEADKDKDGKLNKEEIINKYDLFVGSQATDFGEALGKAHDEF